MQLKTLLKRTSLYKLITVVSRYNMSKGDGITLQGEAHGQKGLET